MQNSFVEVNGLAKKYGDKSVLHDIDLRIGEGEIVGLIGPNGAGKSTLLKAIMGLIKYSGHLSIFGKDPFKHRTDLLKNMSYIADVASLPGWMKVSDLLIFVRDTHPKFDHQRALSLLSETPISLHSKIETLSKGMKTRLHLVTILSINTDFLVLDEPTLGLDVLVRREFQDRLVKDYYNQQRSILVTTHQVDEIESILTRVVFIKEGRITLDLQMADLKRHYFKLVLSNDVDISGLTIKPIYQRQLPDSQELIFENPHANSDADAMSDELTSKLSQYGQVLTPSLEDLFVATNA